MSLDDKDLRDSITRNRIDAEILYFKQHTMTVDSAVEQLKVPKDFIVKSILVINDRNEPFMIFVNGDRKVSFEKVAEVTNSNNIRMARAKEVKEILGYEVGGVPPIFYKNNVGAIMDERVLGYEFVIGGGGATHALLKIRPKDIFSLNNAKIYDVSE